MKLQHINQQERKNEQGFRNGPSSALVDIVLFRLSFGIPLKVFKACLLGRVFDTRINNVSTEVGSHNPPSFGAQRPRWHTASCPPSFGAQPSTSTSLSVYSDTICNGPSPPLANIVFFGLSLSSFPSRFLKRLLGRSFHTLINNVSFSSPTNVGSHNPPFFRAQRPRCHTTSCPPSFRAQPSTSTSPSVGL